MMFNNLSGSCKSVLNKISIIGLLFLFIMAIYGNLYISVQALQSDDPISDHITGENAEVSEITVDPKLKETSSTTDNIIVSFKNNRDYQSSLEKLQQHKEYIIQKEMQIISTVVLKSTYGRWKSLKSLDGVISIWGDHKVHFQPIQPNYKLQKALESTNVGKPFVNTSLEINAHQAKQDGYNGSGIVIAVIDSGADITGQNPDIDDLDDSNATTTDLKYRGAVSVAPDDPLYYTDLLGRGTHHTGAAVGTGHMNESFEGIAPGALYLGVKVFDPFGVALFSNLLSGLTWSVEHGADIVLFCSSLPGFYNDPISIAINRVVELGIAVVVPSGDDGPSFMSLNSPGQALKAITVGAYNTTSGDIASFSGRGPSLDFRNGVDIVAPGVNIVGPRPKIIANLSSSPLISGLTGTENLDIGTSALSGISNISTFGTRVDANYSSYSGTSVSAALVAGGMAILMQEYPLATVELLKIALVRTAIPITRKANIEGAGLINIEAAREYLAQYFTPSTKKLNPIGSTDLYPGFVSSLDSLNQTLTNPNLPSDWNAYETAILMSTHALASTLIVTNSSEIQQTNGSDFTTLHLPLGLFGIKYDDKPFTFLAQFEVAREFHLVSDIVSDALGGYQGEELPTTVDELNFNTTAGNTPSQGYNRYSGMLTDGAGLYIPIMVDVFEYTDNVTQRLNVFSISIGFINTKPIPIENISLGCLFKADLYLNETSNNDFFVDDQFTYLNATDMVMVSDTNNNTAFNYTDDTIAMGFNSTTHHSKEWEIGEFSNLIAKMFNETKLANDTTLVKVGEDTSFAYRWDIIDNLEPDGSALFTSKLGVGLGNSTDQAINSTLQQMRLHRTNTTDPHLTDLIIVDLNITRIAKLRKDFVSSVKVFNLGTNENQNAIEIEIAFFVNRTTRDGKIEIFSVITTATLGRFEYIEANASWLPIFTDVYTTGWAALSVEYLNLFGNQILNPQITAYLSRSLIVIDPAFYRSINPETVLFSPNKLDQEPLEINFPGDFGLWNVTVLSVLPLENIKLQIAGIGSRFIQETDLPTTLHPYDRITITLVASLLAAPTLYKIDLLLFENDGTRTDSLSDSNLLTKLPIRFTIQPSKGRVFFDGIHNNISFSAESLQVSLNTTLGGSDSMEGIPDFSDIGDLIGWDERLDTPFGNFHDLQNMYNNLRPIGTPVQTLIALGGLGNGTDMFNLGNMTDLGNIGGFGIGGGNETGMGENITINPALLPPTIRGYQLYGNPENMSSLALDMNLLQLADVLIMNDPEVPYTLNEIRNVTQFVSKGGVLMVLAEPERENNITSLNQLLANFSIQISDELEGEVSANVTTTTNATNIFTSVSQLTLQDPVIFESLSTNASLYVDNHIALSSYGRGKVIAVGDEDIFTNKGLSKSQNYQFCANVIDWSIEKEIPMTVSTASQNITSAESAYFQVHVTDYDKYKPMLQEGFILISSFIDPNGNSINYPLIGQPLFITWETQPGIYSVQFRAAWSRSLNVSGWFYAIFYFDHANYDSKMFYLRFYVDNSIPPPQYPLFEPVPSPYPHIIDFLILLHFLLFAGLLWFYRNVKRRERFTFTKITKAKEYMMRNLINELRGLHEDIDAVLEQEGYSDLEKIRYLLKMSELHEEVYDRIERFSKRELGEF